MKRLLFGLFLFVMALFTVVSCAPAGVGYGIYDYMNLLLCNAGSFSDYDGVSWQFLILFYAAVLNTGVYFLSDNHRQFSRGFCRFVLVRYASTTRYLAHVARFSLAGTLKFFGLLLGGCAAAVLVTKPGAWTFFSVLPDACDWAFLCVVGIVFFLLLFILKMSLFFTALQLLISYLLVRVSYPPLLAGSLLATSLLLWVDATLKTNFVTFGTTGREPLYIMLYTWLTLLIFLVASRRMKKKEF